MTPSGEAQYKPKSTEQKNSELEMEDDENIACLMDLKRWKFKGQYHN